LGGNVKKVIMLLFVFMLMPLSAGASGWFKASIKAISTNGSGTGGTISFLTTEVDSGSVLCTHTNSWVIDSGDAFFTEHYSLLLTAYSSKSVIYLLDSDLCSQNGEGKVTRLMIGDWFN